MVYPYSGGSGLLQKRVLSIKFSFGNVTTQTGNPTTQATPDPFTLTVNGPRASAAISAFGGTTTPTCDLRLYGLTQSHMQQLTVVNGYISAGTNTFALSAGIDGQPLALIYNGNINRSTPDYTGAPDVFLQVQSNASLPYALQTTSPLSYAGTVDVATIMQNLATSLGFTFANDGVQTKVPNPYLWGSPLSQIDQLAEMANINHYIDHAFSPPVLAIWPQGGQRKGQKILISPSTGLVGYPTPMPLGVNFTCLFNPSIVLGCAVQIQSSLPSCTGTFQVVGLEHTLESETPGGAWFTHVTTNRLGISPAPVVA